MHALTQIAENISAIPSISVKIDAEIHFLSLEFLLISACMQDYIKFME